MSDDEVEGCGIVTGNVYISNTDWTDLSMIVALEQVDGTLSVFNNHSLEHLDDLTGLRSAGTVDLQENHALTDVTGLNGLESLDELRIYDHDSLTDLNLFNEGSAVTQLASLTVSDLAVVDMDDFNGITQIGYQLIIENNALLTDISGLANLESINDDVPDCTDDDFMCEMMGSTGEFTIRYNDSMTDIDGFASLTTVDANTMNITHNDSLEDVSGFANLATSKAAISLSANPSLTTVSGFESLTTIDQFLSIESNNVLVDIDGFNAPKLRDCGFKWKRTDRSDGLRLTHHNHKLRFVYSIQPRFEKLCWARKRDHVRGRGKHCKQYESLEPRWTRGLDLRDIHTSPIELQPVSVICR